MKRLTTQEKLDWLILYGYTVTEGEYFNLHDKQGNTVRMHETSAGESKAINRFYADIKRRIDRKKKH